MYFWCICGDEGDLRVLPFRHLPPLPSVALEDETATWLPHVTEAGDKWVVLTMGKGELCLEPRGFSEVSHSTPCLVERLVENYSYQEKWHDC